MSKKIQILLIINLVILVISLLVIALSWWQIKQIHIKMGLVEPNFPYRAHSNEKLLSLFDQNPGANVATVRSPEETHALFIQYLSNQDVDNALLCCVAKSKRDDIRKTINTATERGMYDLMLSDISEIKEELVYDNGAVYIYASLVDGVRYGNHIKFLKNTAGIWLIESF